MSCKTCKWWDEDDFEPDEGKRKHGFCRRYPPKMKGDGYYYPQTDDFAWCGEYELQIKPIKDEKAIGYGKPSNYGEIYA